MALQFLDKMNQNLAEPRQLSDSALDRLSQHVWKGNVRDLQNTVSRSILWSTHALIEADDLHFDEPMIASDPMAAHPIPQNGFSLEDYLGDVRKQMILKALDLENGNQSAAAKRLGLSPQAVHKFLKTQAA
jgi:two-component system response regulator PilR (NtrC family)